MRSSGFITVLVLLFCLSGCSVTRVILLPDEQGSSGAVIVATEADSKILDTPYQAAKVGGFAPKTVVVNQADQGAVSETYQKSLQALPGRTLHITLYFVTDSIVLTEASKRQIPEIIEQINATEPPVILNIIGHTDTTGPNAYNNSLSLKRARAVETILRSSGVVAEIVRIQSYGENDPLVPTPDGVPEPRNRRVEVMVL